MARRPKEGAPARGGGRTRDVRPKAKPKPRPRPSAQPSWMGNWKPVAPRIQTSPDADLLLALEAIYGPQRDFIQQTIDAQEKKAAAQAAYQRDWYAKMAQWMQGTIPGAIGGAYNQAAQNQSAFGQGFSDAMKVANQESAAGINANLSQWGAPEGQQVAPGQAEGAANVVYGMGGFIPANTLNQQGAAFSSAANLQIPAYLDSAAKKTLAYLADSDESLAGLRSKLIELQSDRAAKTYSALEDRKAARAKAKADAAEAKARARVEQAEALQKYANKLTDDTGYIWIVRGNKVVNTGTPTLDREKAFADEQEPSRISTTLSAEKGVYVDVYGRAVLGRDGKPIPYNPKKSGGSSGGSGGSSGSYLLTVKGGDIYRVDRKTGKMTLERKAGGGETADARPTASQRKRAGQIARDAWNGVEGEDDNGSYVEHMSYQEALKMGMAEGIPLAEMQRALNTYWAAGRRGIKRGKNGGLFNPAWEKPGEGRPAKSYQERNPKSKRVQAALPLSTSPGSGSEFSYVDAEGAPDASGTRHHAAKDWFAPAGSAVVSPEGGKVVEVKASRGNSGQVYGGVVKVQTADGRVWVFRHVDPRGVRVGQRVKAGQKIASVSAWTGGSTHAHIEHWKSLSGGYRYENMLDPMEWFRSYA